MTDKLTLYRGALSYLQERTIASLSEAREPVRVLNDIYDQEVAYCLEREFWNFTYRAIQLDADSNFTPSFGYNFAFLIPTDWIRTRRISATPEMLEPITRISEEAGYWFCDLTPLYIQYNSNDPQYGMNLGKWPPTFADYVEVRLARRAAGRITSKAELLTGPDSLIKQEYNARRVAAANCAMNEAVAFAPMCSWAKSRRYPGPNADNPTGPTLIP
ncbi:MAG TPA: hypothetical protein VNH21_03140 [Steroidobacteraceae bacterium]|nr:hypothetical protein [Steroidobacteraceae bacterium]